jgi:hypothetical protein
LWDDGEDEVGLDAARTDALGEDEDALRCDCTEFAAIEVLV